DAFEIDEGYFGEVRLDGLRWATTFHWPGPVHLGNGSAQAIIDERAGDSQREALLKILSGEEQEPTTPFNIYGSTIENEFDPLFLPIEFEFDLDRRTGRALIPGILEASSEPIRNPVTGAEHRARVQLPEGFEYHEAEMASGSAKGTGEVKFDWTGRHSSLSYVTLTPYGLA
ncbi:MAG: DUF1326 domain-containing protein, partial [Alphaproteobacteria bacterium]